MNKQGFTLLEVSLFFAITGLLALVAFAGLGPRLRNVRFTDSVRSFESSTQKQLADFQAGVNGRGQLGCAISGSTVTVSSTGTQEAGSAGDCIINGRYVVFLSDRAVFYPVISSRKEQPSCTDDATYGKIFCHLPTIVGFDSLKTEVQYRNGATKSPNVPPAYEPALLYIQDPDSTETNIYPYTQLSITDGNTPGVLKSNIKGKSFQDICLGLSGRKALIQYSSDSLKPVVRFEGC